jgi:hypothetical protein
MQWLYKENNMWQNCYGKDLIRRGFNVDVGIVIKNGQKKIRKTFGYIMNNM